MNYSKSDLIYISILSAIVAFCCGVGLGEHETKDTVVSKDKDKVTLTECSCGVPTLYQDGYKNAGNRNRWLHEETPNLHLQIPAYAELNWEEEFNDNWRKIDAACGKKKK